MLGAFPAAAPRHDWHSAHTPSPPATRVRGSCRAPSRHRPPTSDNCRPPAANSGHAPPLGDPQRGTVLRRCAMLGEARTVHVMGGSHCHIGPCRAITRFRRRRSSEVARSFPDLVAGRIGPDSDCTWTLTAHPHQRKLCAKILASSSSTACGWVSEREEGCGYGVLGS